MDMKNMAKTPAELKEEKREMKAGPMIERDKFPYGLRLDLNDEIIEKLGLDALPTVGGTVTVMAEAQVIAVRQSERAGSDASDKTKNDKDRSIELQIVKMGVEQKKASKKGETVRHDMG